MRLPRSFPIILLVSLGLALIIGVLTSGCAGKPVRSGRVDRCYTDPRSNAMHCDGVTFQFADNRFIDWVCHRIRDDEFLTGGSRD